MTQGTTTTDRSSKSYLAHKLRLELSPTLELRIMAKKLTSQLRLSWYHVALLLTTGACIGASAQQVKPGANPATPSSTPATSKTLVQQAPTARTSYPRPLDYDYHDFKQPANIQKPAAQGRAHWTDLIKPPGMAAITDPRLAPPMHGATPLAGVESIWGEQYEWLRQQVRKLHRHGLQGQVDALQEKYPRVNLTLLYHHYSKGGLDYDTDGRPYLYRNGTYQWQPYYGDTEEGYWYNGTYFPGEEEVPERDGGYFYNGTWYPGEQDRDEGRFYNGTYYPGEEDFADGEDAYYYNGTRYFGGEQDEDDREGRRHKGMMWQQQYYPEFGGAGVNNVDNTKQQPIHNQQQPSGKWEGYYGQAARPLQQQNPQQGVPSAPRRLPMVQQRPPPRRQMGFDRIKVPNRPPQLPVQANANPIVQRLQGTPGKQSQPVSAGTNSETPVGNNPGKAALTGNEPTKEQIHPSPTKSTPTAVSWGIVLAALLGASIVLAPLACLLYKYRQETRVKKRTFLKRPEHGSVDDGILDALVMRDLGEKKDSRIRQVDKAWGRSWKGASKATSAYRTTYELKPMPTGTTSAHVHQESHINIT